MECIMQWGLEHRQLGPVRTIGVDEIDYGRGHNYLTLAYQIEAGCVRLLWAGRERTEDSFEKLFTLIGMKLAGKIVFVCSDMWKPYLKLIARHFTTTLNILNCFHVVAKMNLTIGEECAGEVRRMAQDGYEPVLKKSCWCLSKRKSLTENQRIKLSEALRYSLQSVRTYLLKKEFPLFWTYDSPTLAGKFLDQWCSEVMCSRIEPMKKFARTMRAHRELLLNYFLTEKAFSSRVAEGLNNRAKITGRKIYSFRTIRIAEISLYHVLGKLPEPKLPHSFC